MRTKPRTKSALSMVGAVLAVSLVLSACDEAEQGRILRYEKGVYLGQKDPPLSDQDREILRQRTWLQRGG